MSVTQTNNFIFVKYIYIVYKGRVYNLIPFKRSIYVLFDEIECICVFRKRRRKKKK